MKKILTLSFVALFALTFVVTNMTQAQSSVDQSATNVSPTQVEDGDEKCPCGVDDEGFCIPCDDESATQNECKKNDAQKNTDEGCPCGVDDEGFCIPCDDDE